MRKYDCEILIGTVSHTIKVNGKKINGAIHYDTDSLVSAQKEFAEKLLLESGSDFNIDIFNFVINVSGIKGSELADLMELTPANISKARRNKGTLSKMAWKLFRLVMLSYLAEKKDRATDLVALKPTA